MNLFSYVFQFSDIFTILTIYLSLFRCFERNTQIREKNEMAGQISSPVGCTVRMRIPDTFVPFILHFVHVDMYKIIENK